MIDPYYSVISTQVPSIFGLGGVTDIYELFFTDKQHQEENGMTMHIHESLHQLVQERVDVPEEAWDLYLSRFFCLLMNDTYGLSLPSRGWGTPKLHSKVFIYVTLYI